VPVEVIGVPAPGEWAVIRTPLGILWPTGRVKDYDRNLTELTDGPPDNHRIQPCGIASTHRE
jgi:hypothetical protein